MHSYSRNFIIILLWSFFLWELFLQFPFCLIRQLIPNVLNSKYPFVQAPPHAGCRKSLLVTFQGSFWTQCWETKFRDLPILSRITNICYSGLKEYCKIIKFIAIINKLNARFLPGWISSPQEACSIVTRRMTQLLLNEAPILLRQFRPLQRKHDQQAITSRQYWIKADSLTGSTLWPCAVVGEL